jgi:hypothetical protein
MGGGQWLGVFSYFNLVSLEFIIQYNLINVKLLPPVLYIFILYFSLIKIEINIKANIKNF